MADFKPAKVEELTACLKDVISHLVALKSLVHPGEEDTVSVTYDPNSEKPLRHQEGPYTSGIQEIPTSNHALLPFKAQEHVLELAIEAFLNTLAEGAPYFKGGRHKYAFVVVESSLIRVLINGVGDHVSCMPVEEAALGLAYMRHWFGHLSPGSRSFDVKGRRILADTPQEALAIHSAMMQPDNPDAFIGNQRETVFERHTNIQIDPNFFKDQDPR